MPGYSRGGVFARHSSVLKHKAPHSWLRWCEHHIGNGSTWVNQEVLTMKLIGQGKAPNLKARLFIKTTINANGEITVDLLDNQVDCK